MLFPELEESTDLRFMSYGHVELSLRENDQVLVIFASMRVDRIVVASVMHVVCKFPNVFPRDICNLPPK